MAKKKSELISSVGVLLSIVTALVNAVRKQGGTDEDIYRLATPDGESLVEKIAAVLVEAGRPVVEAVKDTFALVVDYGETLAELVRAGKYDFANEYIIAKNFPHDADRGAVEVEAKLFYFNREMTSEGVIAEMEKAGYKPADLPTLCAFGAKFPEKQREFPIVALKSVWRDPVGGRSVPCLSRWDDWRGLSLFWFDLRWDADFRFLAVRA